MGSTWILIVLSTKFRLEFCQWPPYLTVCQWLLHLLSLLFPFLLIPFLYPLNSASLIFVENWEYAATQQSLKVCFPNTRPCAAVLIPLLVCRMPRSVLSDLPGVSRCLFCLVHSFMLNEKRLAQACPCFVQARTQHLTAYE